MSGAAGSALERAIALITIEPDSHRENVHLMAGAGRANRTLVVRQEVWRGRQILTVNSGCVGLAATTPAENEALPKRITAASIVLRARRSNCENKCRIRFRVIALEQVTPTFKIRRINLHGLAAYPKRHLYRNA